MIDIQSEIFNEIANAVRKDYPNTFITGEYIRTPPSFPCISVEERNNVPLRSTQTTSSLENHTVLMYEINVYSNKTSGRRGECVQLMEVVDKTFAKLGFSRRMMDSVANIEDATIYRLVARYEAVAGKNGTIYRR